MPPVPGLPPSLTTTVGNVTFTEAHSPLSTVCVVRIDSGMPPATNVTTISTACPEG
jgi:hypothetical protein